MRNKRAITPELIEKIKYLLNTSGGVRSVATAADVSPYTVYRVKMGCYDTGKLIYKYEKAIEKGMFNPSERENWLI